MKHLLTFLLLATCCFGQAKLGGTGTVGGTGKVGVTIASGGTVAFVASSGCDPKASGVACTITTTGVGSGLFLMIQVNSGTGVVSNIADGGDSFTQVPLAAVRCGSILSDFWYTPATGGARTSVTVTTDTGTAATIRAIEVTGTNATSPVDQVATNGSSFGNAIGPAVTITAASELILSIETVSGSVSAIASPFTLDGTWNAGDGWAYMISTSTGTYTPTWTNSGSGACGTTASFKP